MEARFYEKLEENKVRCHLCAHECKIEPGKRGLCHVRENRDGVLSTLVYGRIIAANLDPIEKKPLFHFLPGSLSYSIATVGCNFMCLHCQNFDISQYPRRHGGRIIGEARTPQMIVDDAVLSGSAGISYTYTEPTVFMEFAQDVGELARRRGLKNVFVSNGFMTAESAGACAGFLDADNVDLKSFRDDFYRKVCKARLTPVLETIERLHRAGVWLEVTTLVIPGLNDSPEELGEIARFLRSLSPGIPWHVSAFHPTHEMLDRPRTPAATLLKAREIGLAAGLRYVYTGNIPGQGGENTVCYACGALLVERLGYRIRGNFLQEGRCPQCQAPIDGVWQ
ncbi:MAG: AmmeMemoRadiSam system radical SAM enzyme [Deltaproteobacteria bacterium]|nr:AmmeMemoRadiSam system radical SAM enzyme [Deltaproteobacteria bacterium]